MGKVVASRSKPQSDGVLITGGTGILGRTVAGWLVQQGTKGISLVSRRGRMSLEAAEQLYSGTTSPGYAAEVTLHSADISVQVS